MTSFDLDGSDRPLQPGDSVVLVGGTGLIGVALARATARRGLVPIAVSVDELSSGQLPSTARHLLMERADLPEMLDTKGASPLDLPGRALGVVEILAEDLDDVTALLDVTKRYAGRSVAIGSASVLGPCVRGARNSEDVVPRPNTELMRTKLAIEALFAEHHGKGRACVNLRCAYPYGPGHPPMTPLGRDPELFHKLERHEPFVWVEEEGLAPIQPLWADDLAEAIAELLVRPRKPSTLYNIAGPEVLSWDDYLRVLARGRWPQRNMERRSVDTLQAENPNAWWLHDHLPYAPTLDDSLLRRDVYSCETKLSDVVDEWASSR